MFMILIAQWSEQFDGVSALLQFCDDHIGDVGTFVRADCEFHWQLLLRLLFYSQTVKR